MITVGSKQDNISPDRLKPAHPDTDEEIVVHLSPTKSLSPNPGPDKITDDTNVQPVTRGRTSKPPIRYNANAGGSCVVDLDPPLQRRSLILINIKL